MLIRGDSLRIATDFAVEALAQSHRTGIISRPVEEGLATRRHSQPLLVRPQQSVQVHRPRRSRGEAPDQEPGYGARLLRRPWSGRAVGALVGSDGESRVPNGAVEPSSGSRAGSSECGGRRCADRRPSCPGAIRGGGWGAAVTNGNGESLEAPRVGRSRRGGAGCWAAFHTHCRQRRSGCATTCSTQGNRHRARKRPRRIPPGHVYGRRRGSRCSSGPQWGQPGRWGLHGESVPWPS